MLFLNKYHNYYKNRLLDYGLFYFKCLDSDFLFKNIVLEYLEKSFQFLKLEYDSNLCIYNISHDKFLFKSNLYLLGLEIQYFIDFLSDLYSRYYVDFGSSDLRFLDYYLSSSHVLLSKLENKLKSWRILSNVT